MSRAEEKATEKYPPHSILIVPARSGGYYADGHLREGFIEGYHQAEFDLQLTWEDIERIDDISIRLDGTEEAREMSNKDFYQEVLKRFKETKGE